MNYYGYDNEINKKRKVDSFSTEKKNNNHKRRSIEIFKKELSYFNCSCKNVVCKECFIKWRKQNNICPFCRRTIIT